MDAGHKRELEAKVYAGERLSRADGEALFASDDLVWLGRLAHHRRTARGGGDRTVTGTGGDHVVTGTARGGNQVVFATDRQLNLTNLCAAGCPSCAAVRDAADERSGYPVPVAEAVRRATELAGGEPITELHLGGGSHPAVDWGYYPEVLRAVRAALPDVGLTALSAGELRRFAERTGRPVDELLAELIDAGLTGLGIGAAESVAAARREPDDHARRWADWSSVHRLAHARGLRTAATMRYGDDEEAADRVDHLLRLRDLQDETGGFSTFIPLRYQPAAAAPADAANRPYGPGPAAPAESLKTFAVSRLLLDNVPHLRCCWANHGLSLAQLAFQFGADELTAAPTEHRIAHGAEGGGTPDPLSREDLVQAIRDADCRPVERDARYRVVREYDAPQPLAQRRAEPQQVWA